MGFGVSEPQVPRVIRRRLIEGPEALADQFRAWAEEPGLIRLIVSHGDVIEEGVREVLRGLAEKLED
jgi:hypothetical protein